MRVELTLQWDRSGLRALRAAGLERALERAVSRAGGDAIRAVRVAANRHVRSRKALKVKRVNSALVTRWPLGTMLEQLVWRVNVSGAPIAAIDYPHREVRRGVSLTINKGHKVLLSGAFLATMRSGHTGVFRRRGKSRLPIDEVYSSTVADVLRDHGAALGALQRGQEVFSATFARLLPLELAKLTR